MFRKQITIALACAGLICASTTGSTANTAKQNATAPEPVLVARNSGGTQGKPGGGRQSKPGGKQGSPTGDKPVATA
jgi:hypothetical protein